MSTNYTLYFSHFRPIAVGATSATSLAVIFTFANTMLDLPEQATVVHKPPTFYSFMLAFGTIIFSFGGSGTFPTIQQDMKQPNKFPFTVCMSYMGMYT